jgi:hypothetical protein
MLLTISCNLLDSNRLRLKLAAFVDPTDARSTSWLNKSTIRTERNVVKRRVPPRAEAIVLVPARSPVRFRWSHHKDTLYIHLERELGSRWTPRRSSATRRG